MCTNLYRPIQIFILGKKFNFRKKNAKVFFRFADNKDIRNEKKRKKEKRKKFRKKKKNAKVFFRFADNKIRRKNKKQSQELNEKSEGFS